MADFTNYVRQFRYGAAEPDSAAFEICWAALTRALRAELTKRGLWNLPPRYLGVDGAARWLDGDGDRLITTAFDELTADCFCYIFVDRAQSLMAHLDTKVDIDGLVFRNVRNFIFERQRRHDPVGFRTYDLIRTTAATAVEAGKLQSSAPPASLTGTALLSLANPGRSHAAEIESGWVEPFARVIFEALFRPTEERRVRVGKAFDDLLKRLADEGAVAFRLGAVIAPAKALVRAHWSTMARAELGGEATEIDSEGRARRVAVDSGDAVGVFSLAQLASCVSRLADVLGLDERSLGYLHRVWSHFVAHAIEVGTVKIPSARAVARDTGVPRERVPDLKRKLGDLIRRCQSGQAGIGDR